LLARANEARSGDELAGLAASSEQERIAARLTSGRQRQLAIR
jgi:ethanolamine ammonia-lyase large subunit